MAGKEACDHFGLVGSTLEGRFVIDRPIAEGGFGVVYHGEQSALDRPVAVKVLKTPAKFDEAARQQFLAGFAAEAKTIARITHPNIVQVYDYGVAAMPSGERAAWMALEWLTGVTLEAELAGRRGSGGRSPEKALELLRPALAALAIVHAAGVAHRDLKPANIMLVAGSRGVEPKLLDFGIAKIMDADESPGSGATQTRSGQIAFSPGYASPEQISQGRSGPWTDVHAMALVLTEVLTDRAPLEGDEAALIFQQIVDRVRPTPAKFGVSVGPWEAVLSRALAVSPAERYRNATELLQALEAGVTEATSVYVGSGRRAFTPHGSGPTMEGGDTLAAMSTQHASAMSTDRPPAASDPVGRASLSAAASVTTGSVAVTTGSAGVNPPPSASVPGFPRWVAYTLGGTCLVAASFAVAWRTAPTRPTTVAAGIAEGAGVSNVVATPPTPPSPTATDPATVPAPSASVAPPAASSVFEQAPAPSASPKGKPGAPAAALGAPTRARAKVNCDPPFTVDAHGQKHYKPDCNN